MGPGTVGFNINKFELLDILGPLVYILFREDKPLYIGSSKNGLIRPLDIDHLRDKIIPEVDSLSCIPCSTEENVRLLEKNLIRVLQPEWNIIGVSEPQAGYKNGTYFESIPYKEERRRKAAKSKARIDAARIARKLREKQL